MASAQVSLPITPAPGRCPGTLRKGCWSTPATCYSFHQVAASTWSLKPLTVAWEAPLEGGAGTTWDTGRPLPGPQVPSISGRGGAGWLLRAPRITKDGKTGGQAHRLGTQKLPPAPQARPGRRTSPPQARLPSWEPVWPERGGTPRGPGRLTLARPLVRQQLVYPFRQPHSKLPTVLRQKWSQPPLLTRHSLMSAEPGGRTRRREWAGLRCPGRLGSPGRAQEGGLAHSRGGWEDGRHRCPQDLASLAFVHRREGTGVCGAGTLPRPFIPGEVPGRRGGREQGAASRRL